MKLEFESRYHGNASAARCGCPAQALQQFIPDNAEEAHGRRYLLDFLGYLAKPEDTSQ
jgi:hypothetical protein